MHTPMIMKANRFVQTLGKIFLLIASAVLIISIRYIHYNTIQGFDTTRYYMYTINWFAKDPVNTIVVRNYLRPGLFFIFGIIKVITGFSTYTILYYTPFLLLLLFNLSTYYLISVLGNEKLSTLALFFAPMTFFIIRLSYDLIGNLTGLILMNLLFGYYLRINWSKLKLKTLASFLFLVVLLGFFYVWLLELGILIIFFFSVLESVLPVRSRENRSIGSKLTLRAIIILESLGVIVLITVLIIYFVVGIKWILPIYKLSNYFEIKDIWYVLNERIVSLIFMIIGILYIYRKREYYRFLLFLFSWTSVVLIFISLGFELTYRLYSVLPVSPLRVIGIYATLNAVKKTDKINNKRITKYVIVTFLISLILVSTLPHAFLPEYTYAPDYDTQKQIFWLKEKFGFSNDSVIFPIFNPTATPLDSRSSPHIEGWCKGFLGDSVYFGSLISLLSGIADKFGKKFNVENRTIIIASKLYKLTEVDLQFAKKISDLGIYQIRNLTLNMYLDALKASSHDINNFRKLFEVADGSVGVVYSRITKTALVIRIDFQDSEEKILFEINNTLIGTNTSKSYDYLIVGFEAHTDLELTQFSFRICNAEKRTMSIIKIEFSSTYNEKLFWVMLPFNSENVNKYLELTIERDKNVSQGCSVFLKLIKIYLL
ncbi:MAG: hypothetical protein ACP6IS_10720 [Candidatus Asgardarchaeia archaeon]